MGRFHRHADGTVPDHDDHGDHHDVGGNSGYPEVEAAQGTAMIRRFLMLGPLAPVVGVVVRWPPDIARHLKIPEM